MIIKRGVHVLVICSRRWPVAGLCVLLLGVFWGMALEARADSSRYRVSNITYIGKYTAIWWDVTGTFLFTEHMMPRAKNCSHISIIQPDGTWIRCLTCNHPGLRSTSAGQPSQSPDGRWMIFIAKRPEVTWPCWVGPGMGVQHELWVMDL